MKIRFGRFLRHTLFAIGGGAAGYALYYYVGCATGSCAITTNPFSSVVYMAVVGILISLAFSKNKVRSAEKNG